MISRYYRVTFVLMTAMAMSCAPEPTDPSTTNPDTDFNKNKLLFAAIQNAPQVVLYEDLPHQMFERKLLEAEMQRQKNITLHGFPFYVAPLEFSAEDATKLKSLLSTKENFAQWAGEKRCGGFHPDYLAEYRTAEGAYQFLICFGCHEVMVFGPHHTLRSDIQKVAFEQIKTLLEKYRKNRPERQRID